MYTVGLPFLHPLIIINKLKSIYNSPFKDSHSHPIHTCFPIIASNEVASKVNLRNLLNAVDQACNQGIHPDLETQGRYHQESKTGLPVASQKGLVSSNFLVTATEFPDKTHKMLQGNTV